MHTYTYIHVILAQFLDRKIPRLWVWVWVWNMHAHPNKAIQPTSTTREAASTSIQSISSAYYDVLVRTLNPHSCALTSPRQVVFRAASSLEMKRTKNQEAKEKKTEDRQNIACIQKRILYEKSENKTTHQNNNLERAAGIAVHGLLNMCRHYAPLLYFFVPILDIYYIDLQTAVENKASQ